MPRKRTGCLGSPTAESPPLTIRRMSGATMMVTPGSMTKVCPPWTVQSPARMYGLAFVVHRPNTSPDNVVAAFVRSPNRQQAVTAPASRAKLTRIDIDNRGEPRLLLIHGNCKHRGVLRSGPCDRECLQVVNDKDTFSGQRLRNTDGRHSTDAHSQKR
jgi:hypothetical protein